jgi:hypothetical protein
MIRGCPNATYPMLEDSRFALLAACSDRPINGTDAGALSCNPSSRPIKAKATASFSSPQAAAI